VAEPFDVALAKGKEDRSLKAAWAKCRQGRVGFADAEHPFRLQGSADLNSYKMFSEVFWTLLQQHGRMGIIVPSGIYTDAGTKDLRQHFLEQATWDWLFSFENRKQIFQIDERFKFAPMIVSRCREKRILNAAFMVHDLADWERNDPPVIALDPSIIPLFSPRSRSIPEVRTERDLEICRKIYGNSIRIGDKATGWEITYAAEFHMTSDSKHFPTLEKWKAQGYKPDVFGRWIGPDGDLALPLYEGRMIGQFDFSQKGWVSGKGRSAVWRQLPFEAKTVEPQYLVAEATYVQWPEVQHGVKLAFMDVTSATNARTMIASAIGDSPCGNAVPVLYFPAKSRLAKTLFAAASTSSFAFDFATRQRAGGLHLNWFIMEECPLPIVENEAAAFRPLVLGAARLTFLHRRFAPEWLRLKQLYPELSKKEWKHWWAVTEADRLRLRVEIDALCADLYGLDPDDFDWIVRDDPTDPKGFYRVDRNLPFRERLTGLAAAAFRSLKEGKWSAESAAKLTNDEFFEIIGIPEMTTGPDPLIKKRGGCHRWKPEEFDKDDPRHGWTWDHCWQDAVALLGSEDAVRKYVEGKKEQATEEPHDEESGEDGQTDLFGQPLPPKQEKLF
jgi:hypothetical protein